MSQHEPKSGLISPVLTPEIFNDIFQNAPAGMGLVSAEGRFLEANAALTQMLGYSREELKALDVRRLSQEEHRAADQQILRALFAGTQPNFKVERRYTRKDKTVLHAYVNGFVTHARGIAEPVLVLTFEDAAPRLEAQTSKITDRAERLSMALDVGEAMAWEWELASGVLTCHGELAAFAQGAPRKASDWHHLIHSEDQARVQAAVKKSIAEGSEYEVDYRILTPAGDTYWLHTKARASVNDNGMASHVMGVTSDITSRKLAEREVRRRQKELRLVIDAIPSLVAYIDREEKFQFANKAFQLWMGDGLEVEGQSLIDVLGEKAYESTLPYRQKAIRGEMADFEDFLDFKHGGERFVHIVYIPDADDLGFVRGYVAFVTDLTERKRAEERLRRTEKLAATGRLAATIAHEINNPLEAVTNLLYLAKNEKSISPVGREYLLRAEQELSRIAHITRQTLGFYRESAAPVRLKFSELLDEVLQIYKKKIDHGRIRVQRQYRAEGVATGMAGEVRQVFSNLVANALDATESGGQLTLRVKPVRSLDERRLDGFRITVADSGAGIQAGQAKKIFEPFFTTKKDLGTGLGLWLSRTIIHKHGGRIRVKSVAQGPKTGTVFSVFLPADYQGKGLDRCAAAS
jgi:PAS domain S-box-containing protein